MTLLFFPDSPSSTPLVRRAVELLEDKLGEKGARRIDHPSGHPWIVGTTPHLRTVRTPDRSGLLAIENSSPHSSDERRLLEQAVRTRDPAKLLERLGGDGLLAITADGSQFTAGSISGHRRVFSAETQIGTISSDSAVMLAWLLEMRVSPERLAMRLSASLPFAPFSIAPMWQQISPLPHQSYLKTSGGRSSVIRWWHAPEVERTPERAVDSLRQAMTRSLSHVAAEAASVTADLSGGLDSTAIVYALCSQGIPPAAFHGRSVNRRNSDIDWARRAAEDLGLELQELPEFGLGARAFQIEPPTGTPRLPSSVPSTWWGSYGYLQSLSLALGERKENAHFTGIGGDELFGQLPATPWSIMNEEGIRGLPAVRRAAVSTRSPLGRVLRNATDRRSFVDALSDAIGDAGREGSALGCWFPPLTLGPLLSARGHELARSALTSIASTSAEPFDADRGRHQMLESLQFQGNVLSQINDAFAGTTRWHSPYLQREMIEAAALAPARSRNSDQTVKPLLASVTEAFSMPKGCFARPVSGEYSADTYAEFSSRRVSLLEGIRSSQLARADLITLGYIERHMHDPAPSPTFVSQIESLVSLERWLRQIEPLGIGI